MLLHSLDAQQALYAHASDSESSIPYHAQTIEACIAHFNTDPQQGLTDDEVEARRKQNPHKQLDNLKFNTSKSIFLKSLKTCITLLFLSVSALSFYQGHWTDGLLILLAMIANICLQGMIQWKSLQKQKTLAQDMNSRCEVRRNGQAMTLHAQELVPGDILLISSGQTIPADARLIYSTQLQVDESLLTGESVLVPKIAQNVLHPLEDVTAQLNMVFAGTLVKTGKGEAIVTALGTHTVMGKIAAIASKTKKRESPFTKRLNTLSLWIFLLSLGFGAVVIGMGFYHHQPLIERVQIALIMGIMAFPETIPSLAALIISLGVNRLNDKRVLVKNFQAIETVGDLSIICTDKTGTLTENYLSLDQLFMPGLGSVPYNPQWQKGEEIPSPSVEALLRIGRLNNGTVGEGLRSALMGDPIDVALYRCAPASLEVGYPVRLRLPFDPTTLRSAVICETGASGQLISMIKGAPEAVMEVCKYYMKPDGSLAEISIGQRSEFLMFNRKLAYENNLRVIGFAQKPMTEDDNSGPYANAVFIGWMCLVDPPKAGVKEALAQLQQTGTRVVMITGDQKATAEITARDLGLMPRASDEVWLRSDLVAWEETTIPKSVRVFARTKPEEKLTIVESLQRSGEVVAMVGDGVNDSPALQKSDVAIAMGLQGSEAAQESADIILMNDRLDGILHVMAEGRILRRKIHACIRYLLSCNLGLLLFITASAIVCPNLPITITQMLWLNLIIVSVPALVLAIEPPSQDELESATPQQPTDTSSKPFTYTRPSSNDNKASSHSNPIHATHLFLTFYWAALMMTASLLTYFLFTVGLKQPVPVAQSAAFCALAFAQTFNLFNVQCLNAGENKRNFLQEVSSTPITWVVLGLALFLQMLTLYIPGINAILGTTPLPFAMAPLPIAMGAGAILFSLKTMKVS